MRARFLLFLALWLSAEVTVAEKADVIFTIVAPNEIILSKVTANPSQPANWGDVNAPELWEVPKGYGLDPAISATRISPNGLKIVLEAVDETQVIVRCTPACLEAGKSYRLVLPHHRNGKPERWVVALSTKPNATLTQQLDRSFSVRSAIAFKKDPEQFQFSAAIDEDVTDFVGKKVTREIGPLLGTRPGLKDDPEAAAELRIQGLRGRISRPLELTIRTDLVKDIFDQPLVAKGKVAPPESPKTKKDAFFYLELNSVVSRDKKPATSVDFKFQPNAGHLGQWLFRPNFAFDVAENIPTAADSVEVDLMFSYTSLGEARSPNRLNHNYLLAWGPADPDPNRRFYGYVVDLGLGFEADKKADLSNGMVRVQWSPFLEGGNWTRAVRRIKAARAKGVKVTKILPPRFGAGYSLTLFAEAGRSLSTQTVKSSDKNHSLEIPKFDILRVGPQVSAFLEIGATKLSLASRIPYLFSAESTYHELEDKSLLLLEKEDFQPHLEVALEVPLVENKNIAVALSYESGRTPPLYKTLDKVEIGFVARY